ncbi:MAG: tripartite tricarboxylate transporter TctB family protein [Synergistaceae bacterium]|nr:tripartite tricarboxylate transporter TctB family protein [Synergistaceae bacterium]
MLKPGEKVFAFILLLIGCLALYLSINLWFSISTHKAPRISSAAVVPVIVSSLWVLISLCIVIKNFRIESESLTLRYILPPNVLIILALIIIYCAALLMGVRFYIASPVFLYASMSCLMRKDYIRNIIITGLVTALIILVFRIVFSIVLP